MKKYVITDSEIILNYFESDADMLRGRKIRRKSIIGLRKGERS